MAEKKCARCLEVKPLTEFYKRGDRKGSGYTSHCKFCTNKSQKIYRDSPEGKKMIKQYFQSGEGKEAVKKHKLTEKYKMTNRRWCKIYRETENGRKKHYEGIRRYQSTEKGRIVALKAAKKYYSTAKGKEAGRAVSAKRRALKRGVKTDLSKEQIRGLIANSEYCPHCGIKLDKDVKVHVDHIIPLSKGGSHTVYNVQILCAPCNMKKSDNPDSLFNDGQIQMGLA